MRTSTYAHTLHEYKVLPCIRIRMMHADHVDDDGWRVHMYAYMQGMMYTWLPVCACVCRPMYIYPYTCLGQEAYTRTIEGGLKQGVRASSGARICMYVLICVCTSLHIYMHVCKHSAFYTHSCSRHTHTHAYIQSYVRIQDRRRMHNHVHIQQCTHILDRWRKQWGECKQLLSHAGRAGVCIRMYT